ncbi:MAG: hypothetical protein SFX73_07185 [Kofleriaceae bacterium]|nr:hypothetical protein [Kofleriaceae bacterium]
MRRALVAGLLLVATPAFADWFDPTLRCELEPCRKDSARSVGAFIVDPRPGYLTGLLPMAPARAMCRALISNGMRGACRPCLLLEALAPGEHASSVVVRCFAR